MKKKDVENKTEEKNDNKESILAAELEDVEETTVESENTVVFSDEQIIEMQKAILSLQKSLNTSEEKLLRSHAEFENFRKRSIREKNEIRKNTQLDTISAILPVLDHFELALSASEEAKNVDAVLDGMKLIKSEFEKALSSLDVETINAIGSIFDPEVHEAIAHEASNDYEKDTVAKQWRAGYKLGDRLIRPAAVVVSSGSDEVESK
jgi:molecular chaperone GrpE